MNIFLIGSMGVGKSSMARLMAKHLQIPYADTDEIIVDNECKSINGIFKEEGEAYFRRQEADVIRSFVVTKKMVISTGGGLPMYHDNMEYMLENGIVLYLDLDIETLTQRLFKGRAKRPAIKYLSIEEIRDKLIAMLEKRRPVYEMAHIQYLRVGDSKKEALELSKYLNLFI